MTDFTTITACGECCEGCAKKIEGLCLGCIEADGRVPEWAESGRCKVHACAREHGVQFCGLCKEFPCKKLPKMISWNANVIEHLTALRGEYVSMTQRNLSALSELEKGMGNMDIGNVERFIRKQKVAFICSVDEEGFPNVKAMLKPRKIDGIRQFYFSTNTSSMRVKQYMNNPNACIYFYHKGLIKYVGVMLKGKMEVLTDQETKNMIWRKGDTMFYKGGVTDPDYCVLRFTANSGRYYCDLKTESFSI